MRKPRLVVALVVLGTLAAAALPSPAAAGEEVLTLYSPPIRTLPYVHETHTLDLRANGSEAPAKPGYVTGFKEQVLVDSKHPDAKPLSNARFMVHHFLYFAPGRVDDAPDSCFEGSGFLGLRAEEHPRGNFESFTPAATRARYGIPNRKPDGTAPDWRVYAMVMNHVKRPKTVYVRTRVYYTEEARQTTYPTVVGCHVNEAFDVPGGGGSGSTYVDESAWTAPMSGRILLGASHQHGGGKFQTLASETCNRRLYRAPVYHGPPNHVYNTIRPILHEPGPIANGTFVSEQGVPVAQGEVLRRRSVHDNSNLHVAAMGFWVLHIVRDDSVGRCAPLPGDIRDVRRPRRYDRTPNYGLKVPQLDRPRGPFEAFTGEPLTVADDVFRPDRVTSSVGRPITWRFAGSKPHTVTVANGPRGFSSRYSGQTSGTFTFTPSVPGTYRLTCLVHPTAMGQTVDVR